MMADEPVTAGSCDARYEVRDATIPVLVLFALGLCLTLAVTLLGSGLLVSYLVPRQPQHGQISEARSELPPKPRLQTDPSRDLADMRRDEDARLHSYGWIDRQAGTVRIPIDRAMDLLAAQHLGARSRATSSREPGATPEVSR